MIMKKKLLLSAIVFCMYIAVIVINNFQSNTESATITIEKSAISFPKKKRTLEEKAIHNEARYLYEYRRQVNPNTGLIPKAEKKREFEQAQSSKKQAQSSKKQARSAKNSVFNNAPQVAYVSRGPSNFGGRTRALVVDRNDNTGNTIIAGGVSGGVFRTTDGGASWTKVSSNDEIHNVTCIVQDPRSGSENIWYYSTGEGLGNSAASSGSFYLGQGIWQSTDGGITWSQMPSTASTQESFESTFDIIFKLAVHPITGDLYAAVIGQIRRFDGTDWTTEINGSPSSTNQATDIVITSGGRTYAAFSGVHAPVTEGIWTSSTGISTTGNWSRINTGSFTPAGRVVLALAPSNEDKLYALFDNGNTVDCRDITPTKEADLWMWNESTATWTNYSSKLPDESGCSIGNDPFAIQGGYDLIVNVKPDDEDFVVIGGTNAYRIEDIAIDATFSRIGGYASSAGYAPYTNHHPDIHSLVFNPFNSNILFSGTDGGVHRTNDITAATVAWTSLNNNYQTFQFYHVAIDPLNGSDGVLGGAQDNGTTFGGTNFSLANLTIQAAANSGDGAAAAISRDNACVPFFSSVQNGRVFRDCPRFAEITPESRPGVPYNSQFVTYFYLDPDNNNALYYAAEDHLLRTTDATNVASNSWTDLGDTATAFGHSDNFEIFSTTRGSYNASTSYLLMGGDGGHIYRLDDPQNATNISSAIDITPTNSAPDNVTFSSIVTGLAIHPNNNDIVLATYSNYQVNSIYITTNATSATPTWTLVEHNLSSHSIRSAAIAEVAGQTLYFVGTARGLYSCSDPTTITEWVSEAPTQIGFALISSLAYRPSDNHLLIGTHGNGMYEAIITGNPPLSFNKANDISNQISLFPNPVDQEININLPTQQENTSNYSITNITGQSIMKGTLSNNKIDASQLTPGMYFIQIDSGTKTGTKKFIKK